MGLSSLPIKSCTSKISNNEKAINSICLSIFDILKGRIKDNPENAALFLERLISKGIVTQIETSRTGVPIFEVLYMLNLQQNIPEFIIKKYENNKIRDISTAEKIIDTGLNNIFLRLDEYLNIENIRKLLLKNENNILGWMEKTSLNDIGIELEVLLTSVIENLLSQSIISKAAVNYLADYVLNTGKTIKEILGDNTGIILDKAANLIIGIIQTKASNNRETIKTYIIENIGDNSLLGILGGILAKTALKSDIDCIVDVLIDEELTKFLKTKSQMICSILGPMLYRKPADFGFTADAINKTKIIQMIDTVLNTDEIKNNLKTVINIIAKELSGIPIKSIISLFGVNNLGTLITKLEPVILSVLDYFKTALTASENQIGIIKQIKEVLFVLLNEITISNILKNIDCKPEINNIIEIALNDTEVKNQLCAVIEESVKVTAKETGIYDKKIFINDISQFLSNNITENDLRTLELGMFNVFKCVFPKLDSAVTAAAKHDTLKSFLIPSIFDSFKRHFVSFINVLNVEKTIQTEVNSLPPEKIEAMFYKICGLYFRKITLYGWIGLFGGLLSYALSLIL
ncbi:hypothetical protein AGMMS50212_16230 [Spirochaetia bacterium]|nr:hypothetical protein AGMMS50212_16230 [Spirochaetia bacterium]